ncbi:hypothetical protein ACGLFO_06200 [Corynebacterium hesseae]|uniref:hypothetical protein n=1 Tax=Corynebacterium hesseae TaxID=2913502 RepID=UPI00373ECDC7
MSAEIYSLPTTPLVTTDFIEQGPRISLRRGSNILMLQLPATYPEAELTDPRWVVKSHFIDRPHSVREFATEEPLEVGIPGPFTRIEVTLHDGDEVLIETITFTGITDEAPFIVYDRTTLIAPQGTLEDAEPLGIWAGWEVGPLPEQVRVPQREPVDVAHRSKTGYAWQSRNRPTLARLGFQALEGRPANRHELHPIHQQGQKG